MKNSEEIKSQVQNKTPFIDLRSVLDQATWSDFKNLSDSFSSSFGWGFLSCPALSLHVDYSSTQLCMLGMFVFLTCVFDLLHAYTHGTSVYSLIRRILSLTEIRYPFTPGWSEENRSFKSVV